LLDCEFIILMYFFCLCLTGTPLFIQKILAALRDVGVFDAASGTFVPVSSTGAPSAADAARAPPATQHIDWTSELPIPFGVQRIAAARFDRLTLSQQFVLRVAAVLCVGAGRGCIEFDVEAVHDASLLLFVFLQT
jgi:hypothetical protein